MTTPYNGDATGIDVDVASQILEPEDSDSGNAATFQPAFEQLTDYVQAIFAKAAYLAKARTFTALQTFAAGIAVTQSVLNTVAASFVGNGSAAGMTTQGGATGHGMTASAGGAPTADTNTRWGVNVAAGHVKLGGGTPAAATAFSNVVTPGNVPKVVFTLKALSNGIGIAYSLSLVRGYNVASVTRISQFVIRVTFASAFSNTDQDALIFNPYNQVLGSATGTQTPKVIAFNTGYIEFDLWDQGAAGPVDLEGFATGGSNTYWVFSGHIFGAQP